MIASISVKCADTGMSVHWISCRIKVTINQVRVYLCEIFDISYYLIVEQQVIMIAIFYYCTPNAIIGN